MTVYHVPAPLRWTLSLAACLAPVAALSQEAPTPSTGDSMEDEPAWARERREREGEGGEPRQVAKEETSEDAGAAPPVRLRAWGWAALVGGAAAVIAGGVLGGLALRLDADLAGDCPGGVCPTSRHDDLDRRDDLAGGCTALIGLGAAAALAGVLILTVFSTGRYEVEVDREAVAIRPAPVRGGVGLTLAVGFD